MKQFRKIAALLTICLLAVSITACGDNDSGRSGTAMGRYMESVTDYPLAYSMAQLLRSDGTIDVYGYSEDGEILLYNTRDGESWTKQEIHWQSDEKISITSFAYDEDDTLYLLVSKYQENEEGMFAVDGVFGIGISYEICKVLDDGTLENQNIQWENPEPDIGIIASNLTMTKEGDFLVEQTGVQIASAIYQYGSDGRFIRSYSFTPENGENQIRMRSGADNRSMALLGNTMYMQDGGSGSILVYDTTSGTLQQTIPFENFTGTTIIAKGSNDAVYLQNSSGLYRLMAGGSVWEKLIDGELTSMSLPSLYFGYLLEQEDGTFFLQGGGMENIRLYSYRYDDSVPSVPAYELVVYSLEESEFVRQAVGDFQRMHPDTKVNVQVGNTSGSATVTDQIRALNTELLAGKGPDVLLMDSMNVDSFIDKGVLADISEVLTQAVGEGNELLERVVRAYEKEGKLYAVPTKFILPVIIGDEDVLAQITDLNSAAAYAVNNQERGMMGDLSPEALLEAFLPASSPSFLKQNQIDESALRNFLETVKSMADVSAQPITTEDGNAMMEEVFHYAFGRSHVLLQQLKSFSDLMAPVIAMEERGGGTMDYLPGLASKVFTPVNIVGVNSNSSQKEKAMDFIGLMLSDEVQSSDVEDGFPVNLETLNNSLAEKENIYMVVTSDYLEGEVLTGGYPPIEYQKQLLDLALSVEVPYTVDRTLMQMIVEETEDYFAGAKTVDKTIGDIQERTKLYLSE